MTPCRVSRAATRWATSRFTSSSLTPSQVAPVCGMSLRSSGGASSVFQWPTWIPTRRAPCSGPGARRTIVFVERRTILGVLGLVADAGSEVFDRLSGRLRWYELGPEIKRLESLDALHEEVRRRGRSGRPR